MHSSTAPPPRSTCCSRRQSPASSRACNVRAAEKGATRRSSTTTFRSERDMIDLNHGSRAVYASAAQQTVGERINGLIDRALLDRHAQQEPRNYLGGSRIGEPCARKPVYQVMHTAIDAGKGFDGRTLRI